MLYRINRLFNVSRGRAAVIAVLCFIAAFATLPLGADFSSVTLGMFLFSLIYGCIWFGKYLRDLKLIAAARDAAYTEPAQIMPDMTTPGSHRLFVPKPFDRQ
jgi:hypothetical protein